MNGKRDDETPLGFLIRKAKAGRLLILIDDTTKTPHNEQFQCFDSINATVALASRRVCGGYEQINVSDDSNILTTQDCKNLFLSSYNSGQSGKYTLTKEETAAIENIIEETAAKHYLVLQHFASIARDADVTVCELPDIIKSYGFKLTHSEMRNEQKLEEEIQKLYPMSGTSDTQRKLLSVISAFPALSLPLEIWSEWLCEYIEVERLECKSLLNKLRKNAWMTGDRNAMKMNLILARAVGAQASPDVPSLIRLVTRVYVIDSPGELSNRAEWRSLSLGIFYKALEMLKIKDSALWSLQKNLIIKMQNHWKFFSSESIEFLNEILGREELEAKLRAHVLDNIGCLESLRGENGAARTHFAEAQKLSLQEQDMLGLANTLHSMGYLEIQLGQIETARAHYAEAEKLYRQEQDMLGLANTLCSMGNLENHLGQIEDARTRYAEAEKLYRQERVMPGLANALKSMGDLERKRGQIEAARTRYAETEKLYRQEQDMLGLANALRSMGDLERKLGQTDAARTHFAEAEKLYRQEQVALGAANVPLSKGDLEKRFGQKKDARTRYAEAEKLYRQERVMLGLADALQSAGDLESQLGQNDAARAHYAEAEKLLRQIEEL